VPETDGEREVRLHRRDRDAIGIFDDVKARAACQGQLQVSSVVVLDVLAGPAEPFEAGRVEPDDDPGAEEADVYSSATPRSWQGGW
jgi:hypothetical protein